MHHRAAQLVDLHAATQQVRVIRTAEVEDAAPNG
jgi:hypothetical protein